MIKLSWLPRVLWCVTDPWLSSTTTEPIRSAFSSVLMHIHTFSNLQADKMRNNKVPVGVAGALSEDEIAKNATNIRGPE